jgi:FOG: Ankyrin repeat
LSSWSFETYLPTDEILLQIDDFAVNCRPANQTPLLMAAELGRSNILEMLLDAGANLNSTDAKQWSALALAVEKGHRSTVIILLENKIYIDSRDAEDQTPLMIAARLDEIEILSQLVKANADINAEDEKKWTSLSWAVANGHERAVELLLETPLANIDHRDARGRTPFSLAAERGFVQIMQLLIEK